MGLLKAAAEKYPTDPSLVPVTIGELHSLEKNLVWRWVVQYMIMVVFFFDCSYDLFFFPFVQSMPAN